MRQGPPAATPHVELGPVEHRRHWSASDASRARRAALAVHVGGSAKLGPVAGLSAALDLRTAGPAAVGLGFAVDGAIGRLVGDAPRRPHWTRAPSRGVPAAAC